MGWFASSLVCGGVFLGYVFQPLGGSLDASHCGVLQQKQAKRDINRPGKPYVAAASAAEILRMADKAGFVGVGPDAGTGQCVALVKAAVPALGATRDHATKKPRWCRAEKLTPALAATLLPGTVIGYGFDTDGTYRSLKTGNHVAILLKAAGDRMVILDQWRSATRKTEQKAMAHEVDLARKDWHVVTLCE